MDEQSRIGESKDNESKGNESKGNESKDNELKDNESKINKSNDNESKDNEIKELNNKLHKVTKENDNLKKFNEDLRGQVKLLTGKLNLLQQLNNSINPSNESQCSKQTINKTKSNQNDWLNESKSKKMKITDLVTSIAKQNVSLNDYIYDSKSKTYYSKSTGWYYYEESNLFYDPNSKNYYSYDREKCTYNFHCTLDEVLKKTKEIEKKEAKLNKVKANDEEEDGEILSDSESSSSSIEEIKQNDQNKNDENIDPCIRLIIQAADNLDLGSLLIITVTGASFGRSSSCDLQLDENSIDDLHAKVTFNQDKLYYIEDLNSSNGTFLNGKQIKPNQATSIKHDDILRLGDVEFLLHIHDKNNSCVYCEPGCVQAKLKELIGSGHEPLYLVKFDKKEVHKSVRNKIMKKYGISKYETELVDAAGNYQDRAQERRRIKGLSSENFKIEQSSMDKPIEQSNKGFKLLTKWGWQKDEEKDTKLIDVKPKDNRRGLGYS